MAETQGFALATYVVFVLEKGAQERLPKEWYSVVVEINLKSKDIDIVDVVANEYICRITFLIKMIEICELLPDPLGQFWYPRLHICALVVFVIVDVDIAVSFGVVQLIFETDVKRHTFWVRRNVCHANCLASTHIWTSFEHAIDGTIVLTIETIPPLEIELRKASPSELTLGFGSPHLGDVTAPHPHREIVEVSEHLAP
jgi:hypothetical protein